MSVREKLSEIDPELLCMDGFDDCVIGVCNRYGDEQIVAYDVDKVVDKLHRNTGMSVDEAQEYFEFNQLGAYMGDRTPCFVKRLTYCNTPKIRTDSNRVISS